ncbi:hypothetical protein Tcan_17841 [Toxocara canis]|uniref:Uncharacterized protein n=1 Tax=Toxocara canis TaxID=6265 RepID=A0A0B2VXD8_TOXCA|nr:hypothetical protein Tcan_17841 [Toxocara canis]
MRKENETAGHYIATATPEDCNVQHHEFGLQGLCAATPQKAENIFCTQKNQRYRKPLPSISPPQYNLNEFGRLFRGDIAKTVPLMGSSSLKDKHFGLVVGMKSISNVSFFAFIALKPATAMFGGDSSNLRKVTGQAGPKI